MACTFHGFDHENEPCPYCTIDELRHRFVGVTELQAESTRLLHALQVIADEPQFTGEETSASSLAREALDASPRTKAIGRVLEAAREMVVARTKLSSHVCDLAAPGEYNDLLLSWRKKQEEFYAAVKEANMN